jgi:WD40 repeat protein
MTALATPPLRLNPYVGPRPFERGDRLYGRDREVARLRDLLIAERIVLLYSPSGAGKTSLIRAGLVPELEREGFRVRPEIRVTAWTPVGSSSRPGNRYLMSTLLCLEQAVPAQRRYGLDELTGMGLADYLDQRDGEHDGEVLIFDQFEELLTSDTLDQNAKSDFLAELGAALRDRRRWALFAMREDCLAGLDPYLRLLPTRLRTRSRLDLLGKDAARMAIQSPAREAGVDFSDAAAQKLVDSLRRMRVWRPEGLVEALGPYVEPVQLQVVCERLWERPRPDALRIDESDVQEVGDVDSALASYYTDRVRTIATETGTDERAIRTWFDRVLITEQRLRGQVLTGPLNGMSGDDRVLRRLEDAHLVRAETRGGVRWFELAHDRLIKPVRTSNSEWFDAHLQPFQRQAPLWQAEYQPARLLLPGDELAKADRWVQEHPGELKRVEREFLDASRRAYEQQQRAQRQARRKWLGITALVMVLLVMSAVTVYVTLGARSRALAGQAMSLLGTDPADALDKAQDAARWPSTPQAQAALTNALAQSHVRVILQGHTGSVNSADFSADGRLMVTVGADGTARVWNATTGTQLVTFGAHVSTARFSPDGSQVVVTASMDKTARVWDAKTGSQQAVLSGHEGAVWSAEWSPDGSRIATASSDKTARVWDAKTGSQQAVLSGHEGAVWSAEWSPDGSRIATASSDKTARVWDAKTGAKLAEHAEPQAERIAAATFSPDGTHIIIAEEGITTPGTGAAYLWQWSADQPPVRLIGGNPEFSPDGRLVLTVDKQTVHVWDARTGKSVADLQSFSQDAVTVARFSPDSVHVISGSAEGTATIWEVATSEPLVELRGHQDRVTDAAFNPKQPDPARLTVVTASRDGTARVWNPPIGRVLGGYRAKSNRTSVSADGTLVVGAGADGLARVWRAESGEQLTEFRADSRQLESAAFSRDGRYIVTGGADGMARIWQWRTGREPVATSGPFGKVNAVAFDPLGKFVVIAGIADNDARIWEWASGKPLRPLHGHRDLVNDAAFSPDGSRLVTASLDGTGRVWDAATGKELYRLGGHRRKVSRVDFSPDGRFIVTASDDRTARVWDAATGHELWRLKGHKSVLRDAAFSRDGSYVITGADDGMIGVWKTDTGQNLALLKAPSASVTSVQFSSGDQLLITGEDQVARMYDCEICAPLGDLRKAAEDRQRYVAGRYPTL